jgi:ATP-dependent Clp protease ATP-binding subunit ClpA
MADDTFDQVLQTEARDLVALAKGGSLPEVDFREEVVASVLGELDRRRSVLLVGTPGVGKTAVVQATARAMAARGRGQVFEVSTALMLAGTRYIGEWQTKVTRIAQAASRESAVLYVTDAWNLPKCGRTSQNDNNMLDALKPFVESGRLQLLAEASPEVLRAMQRTPGFVRLFSALDVLPLSEERVDMALDRAAQRRDAELDAPSRRALVKLTSRFLAARPQPGPALSLLTDVLDYQQEKRGVGEHVPVSPELVERVFCIMSGLPAFVVSRKVTIPASEIRTWFAERIVGQAAAIDAVVEAIALFKAGLHDPTKPIGTFFFVGPTGVGKTEIARALATFIFGSAQRLLRFDLSEFKDYNSFEMLLGAPASPEKPARLLDPVRAHPFQVVLFDELEKAHPNVWDLLLPLLDEGRLTAPGGDTVDFRNTVVIATSNVGAQDAATRSVGFGGGVAGEDEQRARVRRSLEQAFRPEFLNRFQHVVVFHALSAEEMRRVARQEMGRVLTREGIAGQDLVVDVDDDALDLVIAQGIDARFGARALKREVQRRIVLPLAMTLMEKAVHPGSILKVSAKDDQLRIRVLETETSRAARDEEKPARAADGKPATKAGLLERLAAATARLAAIAEATGEATFEAQRDTLAERRASPSFWKDAALADEVQRELDRMTATSERMERLRTRIGDTRHAVESGSPRHKLEQLAARMTDIEQQIDDAHRELVVMGWATNEAALVEIRPVGASGREARDMLVDAYRAWAEHSRMVVDLLREPRDDTEAALLGVKGAWAHGMLRAEAGLHKLRLSEHGRMVVASVRIAAWTQERAQPVVEDQKALKATGQYGGKVRSRLECAGTAASGPLVLQNERTLAENRELAAEIVASWSRAAAAPEEVVRRYERTPPRLRDALTGFVSGRPDALAGKSLDTLLRLRVDAAARG